MIEYQGDPYNVIKADSRLPDHAIRFAWRYKCDMKGCSNTTKWHYCGDKISKEDRLQWSVCVIKDKYKLHFCSKCSDAIINTIKDKVNLSPF